MNLPFVLVLFIVKSIDCQVVKRSISAEKGDPLTWLLLNQIQRIDSALYKLQTSDDETKKSVNEVRSKLHEHEKESISKSVSMESQIAQISGKMVSLNNSGKVDGLKRRISSLESVAKTHLTASDLVNPNKEINSLKGKVLDLEQRVKDLKERLICPDGWKKSGETCYYFGKAQINWTAAKDTCIRLGGHLVKIESKEENQMLWKEAIKAGLTIAIGVWNGANDFAKEGTWRWESDNSRVQYTNWDKGEPNNGLSYGTQQCAQMYPAKEFKWDDNWCHYKIHFICEKELI